MAGDDLRAAAFSIAALGWSVLPLCSPRLAEPCTCDEATRSEYAKAHSYTQPGLHVGCIEGGPCSDPGKHPLTLGGVKDATTEEATIRGWWAKWPAASIGGATGVKYDVLDCDRAVPERVMLAMPAAKGPIGLTGRGEHYFHETQPAGLRPPGKLSFAPPSGSSRPPANSSACRSSPTHRCTAASS